MDWTRPPPSDGRRSLERPLWKIAGGGVNRNVIIVDDHHSSHAQKLLYTEMET